MSITIGITGASGFLGRFLLTHMAVEGAEILGYSRRPMAGVITVSSYAELPAHDAIIHCAEISDGALVQQAGERYREEAISTLQALIAGTGRLVYASSAMVYGDSTARARKTEEALTAHHAYTDLKLAGEKIVGAAGGVSLRLANLCGPGQPKGTVLSDILSQIGTPGPLYLRNTLAVRDFLWLADVAALVSKVVVEDDLPPVLNAGSGTGISIGDFASRILAVAGEEGREIRSSAEPRQTSLWMDVSETMRLLDWMPQTTIEQGAASLFAKEVDR